MPQSQKFIDLLHLNKFEFITGVPCSILKDFLFSLGKTKKLKHIIATNEGEACAIATGYHLATGKVPVVYMQNSGLGNAVNPLTSLLNKEMFSIPALLLISWRGEPGRKDAPEHIKMGKITSDLLNVLKIPQAILPQNKNDLKKIFTRLHNHFQKKNTPFAVIVKRDTFQRETSPKRRDNFELKREEAIKLIIDNLKGRELIVSTTGKTSRELFEYCAPKKQKHKNNLYMVGSMGSAASIALGIALNKPHKKILIFDGDGAVLMRMSALATIGHYLPKNFYHFIFDNEAHDSTGGQKTVSQSVDFKKIAQSCGYQYTKYITTETQLKNFLNHYQKIQGPAIVVIKVNRGAREDLGRPTITPQGNKRLFMKNLL